ncbi:hypothetical protein [Gemmobacter nanjingensis]|nr:hypothetical protein [Gemmobacter nanjingensis]
MPRVLIMLKNKLRIAILYAVSFSVNPLFADEVKLSKYAIEALRQAGEIPDVFSPKDLPGLIAAFAERNNIPVRREAIHRVLVGRAAHRSLPASPRVIDDALQEIGKYDPQARGYNFDSWWVYKSFEGRMAVCGSYEDVRGVQFIRLRVHFFSESEWKFERGLETGDRAAGMCLFAVSDLK